MSVLLGHSYIRVYRAKKKGKDEHQSYLMVIDEDDNNIGQMRMS